MEYEIKRINAWSVIKIVFLVSFCIGAFIGILYVLILSVVSNIIQNFTGDVIDYGLRSLNVIAIFFLIIFFAIFTSISNSILCAIFIGLYNLLAQWLGGIRVVFESLNEIET